MDLNLNDFIWTVVSLLSLVLVIRLSELDFLLVLYNYYSANRRSILVRCKHNAYSIALHRLVAILWVIASDQNDF